MSAIHRVYNTTALRLAAAFTRNEIGKLVQDLEDGGIYMVTRAGTGGDVMTYTAGDLIDWLTIVFSLNEFREVTSGGDVGNVAAIGGELASDTTPILRGDAAESTEIAWAASNSDIIAAQKNLPDEFDGSRDVKVDLITVSAGTTNAASFTVETSWDGGAVVADTATGAASTTPGTATATIAAADVPNKPFRVTLMLTPAAHTTDVVSLLGVRMRAKKAA